MTHDGAPVSTDEALLRSDSQLKSKDKELIAAYVSGLNDCAYCYGVHAETAAAFGVDPAIFEEMLADIDTARVDVRLKPILKFARQLTLEPSRATQAQADAANGGRVVTDRRWPELPIDLHQRGVSGVPHERVPKTSARRCS